MGRTLRKERSLSRKQGNLLPKRRIYIVCEGEKSEPNYLKEFAKCSGNGLVELFIKKGIGVPFSVVSHSIELKKSLEKKARKSKDPLDNMYSIWTVFDCDEHPKISESFALAKSEGVNVAYSNPCFEIWALWHFDDFNAFIDRHAAQKTLETLHKPYQKTGGKKICARSLYAMYSDAKSRAERAIALQNQYGENKANPYSDVFILLEDIISSGKRKNFR